MQLKKLLEKWDLYVELITRVATQRLEPDEGDEPAAIKSIYELFPLTRETIKRNGRCGRSRPNGTCV